MKDVARNDRAVDEALVGLGAIVLLLAHPAVTRTEAERRALVKSVCQFARCAKESANPRVHELRMRLQATIKPKLSVVISR